MTSKHQLTRQLSQPVRRVLWSLLGISTFLCAACRDGTRKPVYPVQGQVLLDGQPVPQAQVVFHPLGEKDPGAVRPTGQAGPDGKFTLSTYGRQDGAPAGEYAVTVQLWLSNATKESEEGDESFASNQLPPQYGKVKTSTLKVRIKEGENQLPAFQLTNEEG